MSSRSKRFTSAIALLLVFSMTQLYVGVSFAGASAASGGTETREPVAQQVTGILSTHGNKPITVNGATAITGATIVSGADIETTNDVEATVSLGSLGSLKIEQDTKLTLEFQTGSVKVMLIRGCVTLHTKKGTAGEVATSQGVIGKTDPAKDGVIRTCPDRAAAAAIPTAGGLGTAATVGLIGAITLITLPIIFAGRNPSPSR